VLQNPPRASGLRQKTAMSALALHCAEAGFRMLRLASENSGCHERPRAIGLVAKNCKPSASAQDSGFIAATQQPLSQRPLSQRPLSQRPSPLPLSQLPLSQWPSPLPLSQLPSHLPHSASLPPSLPLFLLFFFLTKKILYRKSGRI